MLIVSIFWYTNWCISQNKLALTNGITSIGYPPNQRTKENPANAFHTYWNRWRHWYDNSDCAGISDMTLIRLFGITKRSLRSDTEANPGILLSHHLFDLLTTVGYNLYKSSLFRYFDLLIHRLRAIIKLSGQWRRGRIFDRIYLVNMITFHCESRMSNEW